MKTNKIIKIIDLLKEISNGNIPKKIRFLNHYYIWKENDEDYQKEDGLMLFGNCKINYILNTEVEILEEEKKIPEKLNEDFNQHCNEYLYKKVEDKVNEIIDYLKSKGE